jgi:hypothetical protein
MAMESVWNLAADGQVEDSLRGRKRLVMHGLVKGITSATVTSSKLALLDVLADAPGMPQIGDELDPAYPNYFCVHRHAQAVRNSGGSMAWVWAHYETLGGGGVPLERFSAEDVTNLVAEPTSVFPGTAEQLLCSINDTAPVYEDGELFSNERPIIANYPRVMRALILYGLFTDKPSAAMLNAANKVNDAEWQSLGVGRWLCQGARVRYSNLDGMYAVSVGFLTKGDGRGQDWATYVVPRLSDGQLAKVDSDTLSDLYDQDYEYGKMNDTNGCAKYGFYQTAPFGEIFLGDDFPIGD